MYSELLQDEITQGHFLVVLKPRRKVTGFTLLSGSVYELYFDYTNYVTSVTEDGVELSHGSSSALSAGQYYYDDSLKKLYVRMSDSSNPSTKFVVATFELYLATHDAHWHRTPNDDSTTVVYFDALISSSPSIKDDNSDSLFGVIPIQSSTLRLSNAEHLIEKWIYDSSLNKAECDIYHVLGDIQRIELENVKLVLNALARNGKYDQKGVSINLLNRVDELTSEWRNEDDSFYDTVNFPALNPNFIGKPIRYVYGRVEGFVPVNVDYQPDLPTTGDNRDWAVIGEQTGLAEITKTVSASPSSTTTRTYLNNTQGLNINDTFKLTGSITDYAKITDVNRTGSQYVDHTTIASPAASGDVLHRGFVSAIQIVQQGQIFEALYLRDYTINLAMNGGVSGFVFTSTLESNLSMPETLKPSDQVSAIVYGRVNDLTLDGNSFGSNDSELGNLSHPVLVLYDMLKTRLGLGEGRLNLDSFSDAFTGTAAIGFSIPDKATGGFQRFKNLILPVLLSFLGRIQLDDDLLWKLTTLQPITGDPDNTVEPEEILATGFEYDFNADDLYSEITVNYAFQEFLDTLQSVVSSSTTALYLHKNKSGKSFDSLLVRSADSQVLADRIRFYLGDRAGKLSLNLKSRFFGTELSHKIRVRRAKMPGFEFDEDTIRERDFTVVQVEKGLKRIRLGLDDQKGIEDNEGSW